jgi:hypothetical protein
MQHSTQSHFASLFRNVAASGIVAAGLDRYSQEVTPCD